MSRLQNLLFFGIPHDTICSKKLLTRVNLERSKIYFNNAIGTLVSLFLGLFLAIILLLFFKVSPLPILLWSIVLSTLGIVVFVYEKSVIQKNFDNEIRSSYVLTRLIMGSLIGLVWGFFAQLMPDDSMIGYTLSYIAISTFIHIAMLSYSVLPLQYILYLASALLPLEMKLGVTYYITHNPFYMILATIFFICEAILFRRALINSRTAIQAIILNEKLKDEIQKYSEAQTHIEFLAYHDHLTGVWNRRYIESSLQEQMQNITLQQKYFGIILIDINYFKSINDTYGHNFGDELLTRFTYHLQNNLPHNALLGRIGGDEFIIILQNLISYQALVTQGLELKKALFQSYTINDIEISNSASVGWAIFPEDASDIDSLMNVADERMYEDKEHDHQEAVNF